MTASGKLIHISDILSFYTGVIMSENNELTAPDGAVKPQWETMMQPIIHVAEAVTGEQFWLDKNDKTYDGYKLAMFVDTIRSRLEEQLPWIKEYRKPPELPKESPEETAAVLSRWVDAIAVKHGEWHALDSEAPAQQARTTPKPASFSKKKDRTP